jgi:AcrR family transcriptional regulator
VFGVINVYAERPRAFQGEERRVIEQLGEVVGHAMAAVERKRALLSDEVVELEFHVPDIFDTMGVDTSTNGRITLDGTIPIGDETFLVYGTATGDAVESVQALVDSRDHWTDVRFREGTDPVEFELQLAEPPVLSTVASLGGSVPEAVIENDDYRMTIQVAPNVEVRKIIDTMQEAYPTVSMLARRQVERFDDDTHLERVMTDELTERQRSALQAAYHSGFFEWPRDASGEDVAQSLDVSPPTFHQHLRKAEQKVFESVIGQSPTRPEPAAEE